ncbi:hypothetical protein SZN_08501 [Streptomyces zinciresistens K42]|uniref:Uncharacterized protein n=1 Tax=Streptomyces zinciresistens K42 TaxID=700597 RepID=G2G886_9ACTN|nr:hypothetical protein SZN_08501 [Streptomyces zinciresistens K42]
MLPLCEGAGDSLSSAGAEAEAGAEADAESDGVGEADEAGGFSPSLVHAVDGVVRFGLMSALT